MPGHAGLPSARTLLNQFSKNSPLANLHPPSHPNLFLCYKSPLVFGVFRVEPSSILRSLFSCCNYSYSSTKLDFYLFNYCPDLFLFDSSHIQLSEWRSRRDTVGLDQGQTQTHLSPIRGKGHRVESVFRKYDYSDGPWNPKSWIQRTQWDLGQWKCGRMNGIRVSSRSKNCFAQTRRVRALE